MATFDPDAYLAEKEQAVVPAPETFNPDAWLSSKPEVAAQPDAASSFSPDAWLEQNGVSQEPPAPSASALSFDKKYQTTDGTPSVITNLSTQTPAVPTANPPSASPAVAAAAEPAISMAPTTAKETFGTSMTEATLPAIGGLAGMKALAPLGAKVPGGPAVKAGATIALGLAGMFGGGALVSKAQEEIGKMAMGEKVFGEYRKIRDRQRSEHPIAEALGSLAPMGTVMQPSKTVLRDAAGGILRLAKSSDKMAFIKDPANAKAIAAMLNTGVGSTLGATLGTIGQMGSDKPFNWAVLLIDAAGGALLNKETPIAKWFDRKKAEQVARVLKTKASDVVMELAGESPPPLTPEIIGSTLDVVSPTSESPQTLLMRASQAETKRGVLTRAREIGEEMASGGTRISPQPAPRTEQEALSRNRLLGEDVIVKPTPQEEVAPPALSTPKETPEVSSATIEELRSRSTTQTEVPPQDGSKTTGKSGRHLLRDILGTETNPMPEGPLKAKDVIARQAARDLDIPAKGSTQKVIQDVNEVRTAIKETSKNASDVNELGLVPETVKPDTTTWEQQMAANRKALEQHYKQKASERWSNLGIKAKQLLADWQAPIQAAFKRIGAKDTTQNLSLQEGSKAEANRQSTQAVNDIENALYAGNRFGTKFDSGEVVDLANYLMATRTVEATELQATRGKTLATGSLTVDAAKSYIAGMESNPAKANIVKAAQRFWTETESQLTQLRNAGLISKEAYDSLMANHKFYSPREFVEKIDSEVPGTRKLDSGIKALDQGSTRAIQDDPYQLLSHVVARTQARVFKNKTAQSLLSAIQENPDNGEFRIATMKGDDVVQGQVGKDEGVIYAFVDGQRRGIITSKELAENFYATKPKYIDWLGRITGTRLLKTIATGKNPVFALTNLPRDMQNAIIASGEYNAVLPIAQGQMIKDVTGLISKTATKSGRKELSNLAERYTKAGGMFSFMTTGAGGDVKVLKARTGITGYATRKMSDFSEALGTLQEKSEMAVRLSVFQRAVKNGKSDAEAAYIARSVMDFSRRGTAGAIADELFPYFNASVQGFRGIGRKLSSSDPQVKAKAWALVGQTAAEAFALNYMMNEKDPETMANISPTDKVRQHIVPLNAEYRDKEGRIRRAYLSLPKDISQIPFMAMGAAAADVQNGKPWNLKHLSAIIDSVSPAGLSSVPAAYNFALAYWGNYDAWKQQKVSYNKGLVSPSSEYTVQTRPSAIAVAQGLKSIGLEVSPDRLATGAGKFLPTSNPFTTLALDLTLDAPARGDDGQRYVDDLKRMPVVNRFLRFTEPLEPSKEQLTRAKNLKIDTTGKTRVELQEEIDSISIPEADRKAELKYQMDYMKLGGATDKDVEAWANLTITDKNVRQAVIHSYKSKQRRK